MKKPSFEPSGDGMSIIAHTPVYLSGKRVVRSVASGELSGNDAVSRLCGVLQDYPFHFAAAEILGEIYNASGEFEKGCDTRYRAAQRLLEILPSEEDIALDCGDADTLCALSLLRSSGVDHFLAGDYEMSAAMFETVLDLDGEDHTEVTPTLAFCYVALGEQESLDDIMPDIADGSYEKILLELWGGYTFSGAIPLETIDIFRKKYAALHGEFTADSHEITASYLEDIDSERPSEEARARLMWLRTEHLWQPGFLEQLR